MKIPGVRMRIIFGYRGHNSGFFQRGPNWWQITFPASRNKWRIAVSRWWL